MADWCTTTITINHEDQNKLVDLEKKVQKWLDSDYRKNGFGGRWLGNLVGNANLGTIDEGKETDIQCRGCVLHWCLSEGQLTIETSTAYEPMLRVWVRLLEEYLPDAELIYAAEEPANRVHCTNDPCLYETKYILECADSSMEVESDYEASMDKVKYVLGELLGIHELSMDELLKKLEASEYHDRLFVHEWEYVDITEWE